jgi:hypothetical protein
LNTSELTLQLWGAEIALIKIEGNGMSEINGLKVN